MFHDRPRDRWLAAGLALRTGRRAFAVPLLGRDAPHRCRAGNGRLRPVAAGGRDLDLAYRLATLGKLVEVPDLVLDYRVHPGNVTGDLRVRERANLRAQLRGLRTMHGGSRHAATWCWASRSAGWSRRRRFLGPAEAPDEPGTFNGYSQSGQSGGVTMMQHPGWRRSDIALAGIAGVTVLIFGITFFISPLNGEDFALTRQFGAFDLSERLPWVVDRSVQQITEFNARLGEQGRSSG